MLESTACAEPLKQRAAISVETLETTLSTNFTGRPLPQTVNRHFWFPQFAGSQETPLAVLKSCLPNASAAEANTVPPEQDNCAVATSPRMRKVQVE